MENDNKITIDGKEYDFSKFEKKRSICRNCVSFDNPCEGLVEGEMRPFAPGCKEFVNKHGGT